MKVWKLRKPTLTAQLGTPCSSSATSSPSSSCSSLDAMELDTMEYQELRSGDSLASYLALDCDGLMDSDKSAKLPREVTGGGAGAGLVKMLQSKSHKIILQERSWHTLHQQNSNSKYCILFKDWSNSPPHSTNNERFMIRNKYFWYFLRWWNCQMRMFSMK